MGIVCGYESDSAVKSPPNPNVSDPREGKRRALGLGWPLSDSSVMLSPRVPGTSEPPPLQQVDEERTAVEPLTAVYVMLVRASRLTPNQPLSWNPRLVHTGLRRSWAEAHFVCSPTRAASVPEHYFLSMERKHKNAGGKRVAQEGTKGKSPHPEQSAGGVCVCAEAMTPMEWSGGSAGGRGDDVVRHVRGAVRAGLPGHAQRGDVRAGLGVLGGVHREPLRVGGGVAPGASAPPHRPGDGLHALEVR